MDIRVWLGDLTTLEVDAIVNAANSSLRRGGGVCGAIFSPAGPELDQACAAIGGCETGQAVVTPGFALPARWVIHAVGPVWHGGGHGEAAALASCYQQILAVSAEIGARSVAIPAISTGIYGYPPAQAADVAVSTLQAWPTAGVDQVTLVAFDADTESVYRRRLDQ